MQQLSLPDVAPRAPRAALPVVLGVQRDIAYFDSEAAGVLNPPESTGMGFWSVNPYVGCAFGCAYCYARYAHRYVVQRGVAEGPEGAPDGWESLTGLPPWLAFERRIFVKRNAPGVLKLQLANERAKAARLRRGEALVIGTATDPYQPAERRYRVTRGLLEVLAGERGLRVVIITKSPLVVRDLDLLTRLRQRGRVTINVSLITVDRALARRLEPRAPTPEARLRAIRRLSEHGIDVGVNVMPVLPGITDRPDMLRALVREIAAAGTSYINACALRLQATARHRYLPFIASEFPHLAERYRRAYAERSQVGDRYREGLRRFLREACAAEGIRYGTTEERGAASDGTARLGTAWEGAAAGDGQMGLAL